MEDLDIVALPRSVSTSWDANVALQRDKQRDYCIRHYTGHAPRKEVVKVPFRKPDTNEVYDVFVYKEGDIVSQDIIASGSYEPGLLKELGAAMHKASKHLGVEKQDLYFMDIGGNIGTHTLYMQSLGYPGITFEPMPTNEELIRSSLCANDPDHRVTLFTKGLSDETNICEVFNPAGNKGDGVVSCPGTGSEKAGMSTDDFILSGRLEVTTLDILMGSEVRQAPFPVGALKMDVEGFELKVTRGAKEFLSHAKIPFIVMETWNLRPDDLKELMVFFKDLGYKISKHSFFPGFQDDLGHVQGVESGIKDLFFVHKDVSL